MASYLLQPCGCPAEVPCSCGRDGHSIAQLAQMRRAQQRLMHHIAIFQPYAAEVDARSGQHVIDPTDEIDICCGWKPDTHGQLVAEAETTFQQVGTLRLPHWMADKARPRSRYSLNCAYGRPLRAPLLLEQIGEPKVGPSAVVVQAGVVVV